MEQAINLLIQIPLVGIFVWFVLQINKQTAERDRLYTVANDKFIAALERLTQQVAANTSIVLVHDAAVRGGKDQGLDCMEIARKLMGEK